jgi:hypothetical protein
MAGGFFSSHLGEIGSGGFMQKKNQSISCHKERRVQARNPRLLVKAALSLMAIVILMAGGFYAWPGKSTAAKEPAAPESVSAPEAKPGFAGLKGRWQRPDGGYVIDIQEIDANGKMAAAYFNPRPINVFQAEAALDGTTLKVFIELRDVNYPGATYQLTYDPGSDRLQGVYFQPALQQSFQVFFVRMK